MGLKASIKALIKPVIKPLIGKFYNPSEREVVDRFHALYYYGRAGKAPGLPGEGHTFLRTKWMGVPCSKCPLDAWIYQEILHEIQPDFIIEAGTALGGSALFLAHMLDLVGKGAIITIDPMETPRSPHPRIRYLTGSSTDEKLVRPILDACAGKTLVILDSDHSRDHVLKEMQLYAPYVTCGSYLIVEDSNLNGHPVYPEFGPGPFEAVAVFLAENHDFAADASREKFLLTFNPGGYLKRIR